MNNYYHMIPQCPQCGSPLDGPCGSIIESKNYYTCTGDGTDYHIFRVTLPWKIHLNEIEISYIDWIIEERPEKVMAITWPFKNPEIFSTILAYEYSIKTRGATMIVVPDGDTITGTSILSARLPDFIYVEGDSLSNSSINDIDNTNIFPKVRTYHYSIKGLSIQGRIHAGNKKGFINKIREIYGDEYAEGVMVRDVSPSRFGKIKSYRTQDFKSFYNHRERKISEKMGNCGIIFHEYKNPELLASYINRYNPGLIIILDIIYPFLNDEDYQKLNEYLQGRTVMFLGGFNRDEIEGIIKNNGPECIATLKSFEFINAINDKTNLLQNSTSGIPKVDFVTYSNDLHIKLSDTILQKRLDVLFNTARIIVRPLNLIALDSDNYGLDDIFNDALNNGNGDYEILNASIPDRTANPWADEIIKYVKDSNLDSEDNCIVISRNSAIPDAIARHNLKSIKTVTLHGLSRSRFRTVIMTYLPKSFNPEVVAADEIIFFSDSRHSDYIKYFFKNSKYLEYSNYFIFNDKNMPPVVSDLMHRTGIKEYQESRINYEYTPGILDPNSDIYETDNNGHGNRYLITKGEKILELYDNSGNFVALPVNMDIYVIKSGRLVELNTGDSDVINNITGSSIPLDRAGFYASVKARLIYFLMQNGEGIKINGMAFSEAYKMSRIWLDRLRDISVTMPDLAEKISSLGITARKVYYISTWWHMTETYRCVYIYRIERPKSLSDMIKIFQFIRENIGDQNFTDGLAMKCYGACVGVQGVRNRLLHDKYPYLRERLRSMISSLGESGQNFRVSRARFIDADRNINAMAIQDDDHGVA